jgi:hypothetical protein
MTGKTPLDRLVLSVIVCLLAGSAFGQTKDIGKEKQSTTSSPKSIERKRTPKAEKNEYLVEINSASKFELMTLRGHWRC